MYIHIHWQEGPGFRSTVKILSGAEWYDSSGPNSHFFDIERLVSSTLGFLVRLILPVSSFDSILGKCFYSPQVILDVHATKEIKRYCIPLNWQAESQEH